MTQEIKKEVFKFGPYDPTHYIFAPNTLSDEAIEILSKVAAVSGIGRMGFNLGFSNNETRTLSFELFANFKNEKHEQYSINQIRTAVVEYLSYGLAVVDRDGFIIFVDLFDEFLNDKIGKGIGSIVELEKEGKHFNKKEHTVELV